MQLLIRDIDTLKAYIDVAYTTTGIDNWFPYLDYAQEQYIRPALGDALMQLLLDHADPANSENEDSGSGSGSGSGGSGNVTTDDLGKLLRKVRAALAQLALYEILPQLEVRVSKTGIHQLQDGNQQPIFSTQRIALLQSTLKLGFNSLEQVLIHLEKNEDKYQPWVDSEGYTRHKGAFLRTAKDFTKYWSAMSEKRMTYQTLRPTMEEVERTVVKNILGKAFYNELKSLLKNTAPLSDENEELVRYIKPLVAAATAQRAMPELMLQVEAWGIFTRSVGMNEKNVDVAGKADNARFNELRKRMVESEADYARQLTDFLNENLTDYPLYANGESFDSEQTATSGTIDGQESNGIVML